MTKAVSILGSTGSIGTQTLEVCRHLDIKVKALSAGSNISLLAEQVKEFKPELVSINQPDLVAQLEQKLSGSTFMPEIMSGMSGNNAVAQISEADTVVAAMVGVAGLEPVLAAIKSGKDIALANKETLVAGGDLVMPLAKEKNIRLLPVDSEHSAIWQCLAGSPQRSMKSILLTASGGPFRGWSTGQLSRITVEQALDHPTWKMGGKITIDSATLMNKGLEVIEASWLFDCPCDQIKVVVHPQSIIHSMVEFVDGSVLAQMGFPDMKLPIQLALTWPERSAAENESFNPFDARARELTFEEPDIETFRLLPLAYMAAKTGGTMPAVLNAANEAAVYLFLSGRISFPDIASNVEQVMNSHLKRNWQQKFSFDELMNIDMWARQELTALAELS